MKKNSIKQTDYINRFNGGLVILVGLTILTGGVIASNSASAEGSSATSDVSVSVPSACTMRGTGMNSHNDDIANGIYKDDIGTTTFKALCNDAGGFAIYAVGYTGNEIGGTNSNKLVGTTASGNTTIESGTTTTAGNPDVSNWAMKLAITKDSGDTTGANAFTIDSAPNVANPSQVGSGATQASFSDYHVIPNEYTKVAHKNSGTDMDDTTGGIELTSTYAVYISRSQPTDTYSGQVKYTLVHPSTEVPLQPQITQSGKICYYANASDAVGTMGCQTIPTSGEVDGASPTSATLLASNFSRDGYGFAGWSDKFDYETNGSAKFYGPNETITFTEGQYTGDNKGLSLYAVWVKSQGSIQDATKVSEVCNRLNTAPTDGTANLSSVSSLTDQRDGNTYAIAKLADNKCWMIENLRLESADTVGNNRFDSSITNQSLAQGYGTSTIYGNFGGLADAESDNFSNSTTANSLYYSGTQSGTASINIGTTGDPGFRMPRYNNTNTSARASSPTSNSDVMYSYGNYYTWHAAIADLTYNDTNNQSTTGTSLCPAGWHLPKGGNKSNEANNEIWSLVVDGINGGTKPANYDSSNQSYYTGTPEGSDASNKLRAYPNNFLYSGYFNTSSASRRGSYGYYWSSTAYSSYSSYYLDLNSSYVYPGTYNSSKYYGQSIRCTAGS